MKKIFLLLLLQGSCFLVPAQSDSIAKFIFIPHPRSEDKVIQSALPGIEQINFSPYEMILLGGDLTYYTSVSTTSMDYCDSLFGLGDPHTLWTMGNHDLTNQNLIEEYTGRPSFYSYSFKNITFLVLDTELDASGFTNSHISGDQLKMIRQVCDTITDSDYLILLHHRLLWMVGNEYFDPVIDSVGQSTRQLDTSNFNAVVFPLLQLAKSRGVPVLCLGGDKSMVNINYSPEDSITFIASTMAPEFTDAQNDVVILTWDMQEENLSWAFVPLDQMEKNPTFDRSPELSFPGNIPMDVMVNQAMGTIEVGFYAESHSPELLKVFSVTGQMIFSDLIKPGEKKTIPCQRKGFYIIMVGDAGSVCSKKICVY